MSKTCAQCGIKFKNGLVFGFCRLCYEDVKSRDKSNNQNKNTKEEIKSNGK